MLKSVGDSVQRNLGVPESGMGGVGGEIAPGMGVVGFLALLALQDLSADANDGAEQPVIELVHGGIPHNPNVERGLDMPCTF